VDRSHHCGQCRQLEVTVEAFRCVRVLLFGSWHPTFWVVVAKLVDVVGLWRSVAVVARCDLLTTALAAGHSGSFRRNQAAIRFGNIDPSAFRSWFSTFLEVVASWGEFDLSFRLCSVPVRCTPLAH
jgi:hypothetical protein